VWRNDTAVLRMLSQPTKTCMLAGGGLCAAAPTTTSADELLCHLTFAALHCQPARAAQRPHLLSPFPQLTIISPCLYQPPAYQSFQRNLRKQHAHSSIPHRLRLLQRRLHGTAGRGTVSTVGRSTVGRSPVQRRQGQNKKATQGRAQQPPVKARQAPCAPVLSGPPH